MVLPASVDIRYPERYVLTLRISPKTIFFMISNNDDTKKCLTCKKFSLDDTVDVYENVKKLFFELAFLSMPFAQVIIQWVNEVYSLEPNEMLELYNKQDLYNISQLHDDNKIVLLNKDVDSKTTLLFEMEKRIHGFLTRNMFQPVFLSHMTPLIKYMIKRTLLQQDSFLYVNNFEGGGDIVVFKKGYFAIAQSYLVLEDNELFYYVMKLWEQFSLNQLEDFILYNGLSQHSIGQFKEYVKHVEDFVLPSEMNLWSQEAGIAPLDMISLLL